MTADSSVRGAEARQRRGLLRPHLRVAALGDAGAHLYHYTPPLRPRRLDAADRRTGYRRQTHSLRGGLSPLNASRATLQSSDANIVDMWLRSAEQWALAVVSTPEPQGREGQRDPRRDTGVPHPPVVHLGRTLPHVPRNTSEPRWQTRRWSAATLPGRSRRSFAATGLPGSRTPTTRTDSGGAGASSSSRRVPIPPYPRDEPGGVRRAHGGHGAYKTGIKVGDAFVKSKDCRQVAEILQPVDTAGRTRAVSGRGVGVCEDQGTGQMARTRIRG